MPAADTGRRGEHVSASGLEVQVVPGQSAGCLLGAGEVGVQPAAGGGDDRAGAIEQPGLAEPPPGGKAVPGRAALVDVEDVRSGLAGGDGEVGGGLALPPPGDEVRVGGRVQVPVPGGGLLAAGLAGEHRPAAARIGKRPA
jgi:hypothetical protein